MKECVRGLTDSLGSGSDTFSLMLEDFKGNVKNEKDRSMLLLLMMMVMIMMDDGWMDDGWMDDGWMDDGWMMDEWRTDDGWMIRGC